MLTLIMSTKPATGERGQVSGSHVDAPQTMLQRRKDDHRDQRRPGRAAQRPAAPRIALPRGADRRRGAQHAEPDRPDVEDVACA
jgi:hypothetical protein